MDLDLYVYRVVEILDVVDGDTVDARLSTGFGITVALRLRLAGIDTPEVYGRTAGAGGRAAAAFTAAWLAEHADGMWVRTYKGSARAVGLGDGGFGRWLATVHASDGSTLADALTAAGHTTTNA